MPIERVDEHSEAGGARGPNDHNGLCFLGVLDARRKPKLAERGSCINDWIDGAAKGRGGCDEEGWDVPGAEVVEHGTRTQVCGARVSAEVDKAVVRNLRNSGKMESSV